MPAGTQPYAPPLSANANSQRSSTEPYNNDYGAAIDPALETPGHPSAHGSHGMYSNIQTIDLESLARTETLGIKMPQ